MVSEIVVVRLDHDEVEIIELPFETANLNQVSQWLPAGAYTTFRTYEGTKVLWLEKHYHRLEETVTLAGKSIRLDAQRISGEVRNLLAEHHRKDSRVRITVDLTMNIGDVYIVLAPLITPSDADYENGVHVITCNIGKRDNPKAKLTDFISRAEAIRNQLPEDVQEALIVNGGGQILEGLSSNFFAIKNGEIWVADDGALSGLTMKMVLEEADRLQVACHKEGICVNDLDLIDEAFITSASRSILPVTKVDQKAVGDGKVGTLTKRLLTAYRHRLLKEVELI